MLKNTTMEILDRVSKKRSTDLTEEEIRVIQEASHDENAQTRGMAAYAVHQCLHKFECDEMARFGIKAGHQEFDDYLNELYIVIAKKLPGWEPEKGNLSTYFVRDFRMTCTKLRGDSRSGSSSRYYENIGVQIEHAMDALQKENNREATPLEIQAYIALKYHSEVAIQSIENYRTQIKAETIPLDECPWATPDTIFDNPEIELLRQEKCEEIRRIIDGMEPYHGRIIQLEREIFEMTSCNKIKNSELCDLYNERFGEHVKSDWIKMVRASAERDFQRQFKIATSTGKIPVRRLDELTMFAIQDEKDIAMNLGELFEVNDAMMVMPIAQ